MDQTIEETVDKDTQTPGGTKGFSTNKKAVAKHYLTADFRAACVRNLRYMVDTQRHGVSHPDLTQARVSKDETDIQSLLNMFKNVWENPFQDIENPLCNIATGAVPDPSAVCDILSANQKGKILYTNFISERLGKERIAKFFDKIPQAKLKTFGKPKAKVHSVGGKEIVLKADKNLFAMMTIISQNRDLDMKEVLSHLLGSSRCSPSSLNCTPRKS